MSVAAVMLLTWLVVLGSAGALLWHGVRRRKDAFWGLFASAGCIAVVGFVGLAVGTIRFPNSNLLGGYGLVFGPLWWIGAPYLAIVILAWLITRRRRRL